MLSDRTYSYVARYVYGPVVILLVIVLLQAAYCYAKYVISVYFKLGDSYIIIIH